MNYLNKVKHRKETYNAVFNKKNETLSILGLTLNEKNEIKTPTNTLPHSTFIVYVAGIVAIMLMLKNGSLIGPLIILPLSMIALAPYILRKT